jgi:nucleotide-binding universal stress UspA family protein
MSWLPKKKVVVPVDFSDQSIEAAETAISLVEKPSGLCVIHVLPVVGELGVGVSLDTVHEDTYVQEATEALQDRLSAAKFAGFQCHVVFGDPGSEIVNYAEQIAAELIVLPSHGRTGLKRLLIGSVAERVVRLAHCPVLVLKPPTSK